MLLVLMSSAPLSLLETLMVVCEHEGVVWHHLDAPYSPWWALTDQLRMRWWPRLPLYAQPVVRLGWVVGLTRLLVDVLWVLW